MIFLDVKLFVEKSGVYLGNIHIVPGAPQSLLKDRFLDRYKPHKIVENINNIIMYHY